MPGKPRILYVTTALTAPPHAGCMIRTTNVFHQLAKCGDVTMLAVSRNFVLDSARLCEKKCDAFVRIDLKSYTDYPDLYGRFLRKWHMHWPGSRGLQADASGQKLFCQLQKEHDIVWFHTLGAAHPFKRIDHSKAVMDLDDLNHCKYDLRAEHDANLRYRYSARVQAYKWKRHEFEALKRYNKIVVCSEHDRKLLAASNVHVVPNGFNPPAQKPKWTAPDPNRLGFIGMLGYGPNYDGLVWFRDKVWPIIRKEKPGMKLRIIGSPPPERYVVKADGFEHLGYVEDTTEEMQRWSGIVVPIPYGGGTRIKILDAFSKLCPVISTPIGAHGIEAEHRKELLLAEKADEFALYCLELSESPETARELAEAGWELFEQKYTWDVIGKSIEKIIELPGN